MYASEYKEASSTSIFLLRRAFEATFRRQFEMVKKEKFDVSYLTIHLQNEGALEFVSAANVLSNTLPLLVSEEKQEKNYDP